MAQLDMFDPPGDGAPDHASDLPSPDTDAIRAAALDQAITIQCTKMRLHGAAYVEAVVALAAALVETRSTRAYLRYADTYEAYLTQRHPTLSRQEARQLVVAWETLGHAAMRRWIGPIGLRGLMLLADIRRRDQQAYDEAIAMLEDQPADVIDLRPLHHVVETLRAAPTETPVAPVGAQLPRAQRRIAVVPPTADEPELAVAPAGQPLPPEQTPALVTSTADASAVAPTGLFLPATVPEGTTLSPGASVVAPAGQLLPPEQAPDLVTSPTADASAVAPTGLFLPATVPEGTTLNPDAPRAGSAGQLLPPEQAPDLVTSPIADASAVAPTGLFLPAIVTTLNSDAPRAGSVGQLPPPAQATEPMLPPHPDERVPVGALTAATAAALVASWSSEDLRLIIEAIDDRVRRSDAAGWAIAPRWQRTVPTTGEPADGERLAVDSMPTRRVPPIDWNRLAVQAPTTTGAPPAVIDLAGQEDPL